MKKMKITMLQFISLIEARPALWQKRHREFQDRDVRYRLLHELAAATGLTANDCAKKLKSMKDTMRQQVFKLPKTRTGEPDFSLARDLITWPNFDSLLFMKNEFSLRRTHDGRHSRHVYGGWDETGGGGGDESWLDASNADNDGGEENDDGSRHVDRNENDGEDSEFDDDDASSDVMGVRLKEEPPDGRPGETPQGETADPSLLLPWLESSGPQHHHHPHSGSRHHHHQGEGEGACYSSLSTLAPARTRGTRRRWKAERDSSVDRALAGGSGGTTIHNGGCCSGGGSSCCGSATAAAAVSGKVRRVTARESPLDELDVFAADIANDMRKVKDAVRLMEVKAAVRRVVEDAVLAELKKV